MRKWTFCRCHAAFFATEISADRKSPKNWIVVAMSPVRDILDVWLVLGWFWVGSGGFWVGSGGFRVGSLCMDGVK